MFSSPHIFPSLIFILWALFLTKLFSVSSHILLVLLLLEFLGLIIMLIFVSYYVMISSNFTLLLLFFTLAVCEACLGLGLLINLARNKGSDLMTNL